MMKSINLILEMNSNSYNSIEQADLKSNRLAFLQSLNQYNTQSNLSKGNESAPQRNNFLAGKRDFSI